MHEMIILTWSDYCADCQTHAMLHTVTVQNVQITKYFWMRTENKFAKKKFTATRSCTERDDFQISEGLHRNEGKIRADCGGYQQDSTAPRDGRWTMRPLFFSPISSVLSLPPSSCVSDAPASGYKFLISCNDRKWRVASSASLESHLAAPRPVPHVVCR
jgi:hypothetical protein